MVVGRCGLGKMKDRGVLWVRASGSGMRGNQAERAVDWLRPGVGGPEAVMATAESAGKTCIVCGKDVSGQPRVKDAAGHYMCAGECQQKAIAAAKTRKDAQAAAKPAAPSQPKPASNAPLPPGGLLGQLIDDSPMLNSARCESCGSAMPGGSVICTRCGFNTQTGKVLRTAVIVEKEKK